MATQICEASREKWSHWALRLQWESTLSEMGETWNSENDEQLEEINKGELERARMKRENKVMPQSKRKHFKMFSFIKSTNIRSSTKMNGLMNSKIKYGELYLLLP